MANLENAEESHVHKGPPDFNVHTTAHPAGEIHGQIRSLDG